MTASFPERFSLDGREIGSGTKPFIIAEVAQAHDGSLGAAHAFIDVAADAGADAIKFQTHIASAESTLDEPFRIKFSQQDDTRYAYWQRMEFTQEGWAGLAQHARNRGLVFLSSAFSLQAIELLDKLGMPAWKVASGEVLNLQFLNAMAATGKPILLSSGMSSYQDIEVAMAHLAKTGAAALGLFQCTTKYPTPLEEVGLNVIAELRNYYSVPVGLSDHSTDTLPSVAAMVLGASMIEVHIALHPRQFGPDTAASLMPDQLRELCRARDGIYTLLTHPVDKQRMAAAMTQTAKLFGRSLALKCNAPAGTVVTADMLALKKPGGGISPDQLARYAGRRLARDVTAERLLRDEDFERNQNE